MDELGITDVRDNAELISTWAAEVEECLNELGKKINDAYSLVEQGMDYLDSECDGGMSKLEKAMEIIDDVASKLEDI